MAELLPADVPGVLVIDAESTGLSHIKLPHGGGGQPTQYFGSATALTFAIRSTPAYTVHRLIIRSFSQERLGSFFE